MDIHLTAEMLEWLRELPSLRAAHALREILALLRKHREPRWDERLSSAAQTLDRLHADGRGEAALTGMQRILAFFDPIDSLRDVYLTHEAGHDIKPEDVPEVNARLGALTMQLLLSARQSIARLHRARRGQ